MRRFVWLGVVVGLGLCGSPAGADEPVPLDKLPKPVLDAVKARFPGAELLKGAKEVEDGKATGNYEVNLKHQGQKIDVIVTADGKITEMEKEIAAKDLPQGVAKAVAAKYPKATLKRVEEVFKVENKVEKLFSYEILLETVDKKTYEVQIASEGKILNETAKDKK